MSTAAMQAILTEFCTQHDLTVVVGLIGAIQTPEQVQSFIGFLRLVPSVPVEQLNDLDRNLQVRVRDMQIADLTAENERLRGVNQALEARIAELSHAPRPRPMPAPAAARAPERRPSLIPMRLVPDMGAGKKRKLVDSGVKKPKKKAVAKLAPPPSTPSGAGSGAEDKKDDPPPPPTGLVSTDAETL